MSQRGATVEQLEALYRRDLARFVRTAAAIVGDEALAYDAVHEAFIDAVRARSSFRGDAPVDGWVWRIVVNAAIAIRRRRTDDPLVEAGVESPNDEVALEDVAVRRWIARLPERQRLAVFLRYFADLDYRAIAEALEIEVGTVSATLAAAHAALRRNLTEVKT
jgi:RNA polymerase sigma factor (sigma-70 family)